MTGDIRSTSKDKFYPATYPNSYEDPDPISNDRPAEEVEANLKRILVFADEMFDAFQEEKNTGEQLWTDFICTFRPHLIPAWSKAMTYKWYMLLISCGVHVETGRSISQAEALRKLLYREEQISSTITRRDKEETQTGDSKTQ